MANVAVSTPKHAVALGISGQSAIFVAKPLPSRAGVLTSWHVASKTCFALETKPLPSRVGVLTSWQHHKRDLLCLETWHYWYTADEWRRVIHPRRLKQLLKSVCLVERCHVAGASPVEALLGIWGSAKPVIPRWSVVVMSITTLRHIDIRDICTKVLVMKKLIFLS